MKASIQNINKAFESRVRLGIMSILVVNEWMEYKQLKTLLDLTDGNLASHIAALEKKEFLEVRKSFIGKKPNTAYRVTKLGKKSFKEHIDALEKLLKGIG